MRKSRDFFWNAVGVTINSFNSLFFLLTVRYINGVEEAGIFTYAFAVASLMFTIVMFFNRTFQVADKRGYTMNDFLSLRLAMAGMSVVFVILLCLVSGFDLHKSSVILGLLIFRIVEAVSDVFYGELQRKEKLYLSGVSLTIKGLAGLLVFAILDKISGSMPLGIGGLVLVNLAILYIYDIRNVMKEGTGAIRLELMRTKELAKLCLPVLIFSALGIYLANCQKYILTYFTSDEAQAIFGIIVMPATVMSLAGSYLINPFAKKLTELFSAKKIMEFRAYARRIITALALVGVLAVAVCYFIGIPVLNWLYHMELSEYKMDLMIIVAASVLTAATGLLSAFLTIMNENKKQSVVYTIAAGLSTILSVILIARFGIDGGVWMYGVSAGMLMVAYILLYQKKVKAKITS